MFQNCQTFYEGDFMINIDAQLDGFLEEVERKQLAAKNMPPP